MAGGRNRQEFRSPLNQSKHDNLHEIHGPPLQSGYRIALLPQAAGFYMASGGGANPGACRLWLFLKDPWLHLFISPLILSAAA
jgi:hypothetical protein